jgi:hypothetical protein
MANKTKPYGYAVFHDLHGPRPRDARTPLLSQLQFFLSNYNYTVKLQCLQRAPGRRPPARQAAAAIHYDLDHPVYLCREFRLLCCCHLSAENRDVFPSSRS